MEVVGRGREGGPSYGEGVGWDRKCLVIYWVRTFPSVIMKNVSAFSEEGCPQPPNLLQFQIVFFTAKRYSQK